jgi:hypothetical protein
MMMRTTTTNDNTTNDTNTNNTNTTNDNNTNDTQIIVAVLGIRERFTHPMATTLGRAHTALLRLADLLDVTPNDLIQSAARASLSHATVTALELECRHSLTVGNMQENCFIPFHIKKRPFLMSQ